VFRFITHRPFWVNLLVAVAIVILIFSIFFWSLGSITRHDENAKVPSVKGLNIDAAVKLLKDQGFRVAVQDSLFVDSAARLSVLRQMPEADALVKTHRTIYLTVNRSVAPRIDMPDLKGFSFQSAKLYLQSLGLKLGDTSFVPDLAKNTVVEMKMKGRTLLPGTKIDMGSVVDFVISSGIGSAEINVPDLVGKTFRDAKMYLESLNISLGAVIVNKDVTDRDNAYVFKTTPATLKEVVPGEKVQNKMHAGQTMDLYLSVEQPAAQSQGPPIDTLPANP
jgi:beta-lactam-binding protein with PASTA domain